MEEDYSVKYTYLINYPLGYKTHEDEDALPNGYIVCPCHVINDNEVVIAFDYKSNSIVSPIIEDGKCLNSVNVDNIFDTVYDARRFVESKNNILKARLQILAYKKYYRESYASYHNILEELYSNHEVHMDECREIESHILYICRDLNNERKLKLTNE